MRVVPVSSQVTMKTTSMSPPAKAAAPIEYVDEVLEFRPLLRRVIWLMILLLVAFNAALLGILAYCYLQNETNDSLLWLCRIYFLYSNGNAFLMQNSQRIALGYAILCGVFALVGIRLIWISYSKGRSRIKEISGGPPSRRAHFVLVQNAISLSTSIIRRLKHWYGQWHRAIGVRGPHFDIRLLVEEVFEIGGQTIAAVSASESISNVPLNVVYAAVIFLNSVSAFTFRRLFKGSLIKERLACLLTDLVLDFVWGSLLPIWMYVPIVRIYLNRSHVLDYIATFTNSTREIERVLIISWKLYVLSVVPFVNSLVNFLELQTILREISQGATCLQIRYPVAQRPHNRFARFAHALLPLYGVAVLIVSLVANGAFGSSPQQSEVVCLHRVYPWFSTKEACLGRQINCTLLGFEGASAEIRSILDEFDRSSLADLFLFSCPALEMPSTLQKFNKLMIVVKESTLVQWSEAALIDNNVFLELRTVQLWSVGFVHDPMGLTGSKPIAASVEWIHLENLDGTRIL